MVDERWAVGGDVVPDEIYRATCPPKLMEKLQALLLPYTYEKELMRLPA